MNESFVFADQEVKLTGRTAARSYGQKVQELVEITPLDAEEGTWKKWVPLSSLFKVNDSP